MYYTQYQQCDSISFINLSDMKYFSNFEWHIKDLKNNSFKKLLSQNLKLPINKNDSIEVVLFGHAIDHNYYSCFSEDIHLYFPKAFFSAQSTQGCQYIAYQFNDSSSSDTVSLNGYTYYWDFGDGNSTLLNSQIRIPSFKHTYNKSGTYTVKLIFSNGFCSDTFELVNRVNILPAPNPGSKFRHPLIAHHLFYTLRIHLNQVSLKKNTISEMVLYNYKTIKPLILF